MHYQSGYQYGWKSRLEFNYLQAYSCGYNDPCQSTPSSNWAEGYQSFCSQRQDLEVPLLQFIPNATYFQKKCFQKGFEMAWKKCNEGYEEGYKRGFEEENEEKPANILNFEEDIKVCIQKLGITLEDYDSITDPTEKQRVIKNAYISLAKQWHTDKNAGQSQEEYIKHTKISQELNNVYRLLTNQNFLKNPEKYQRPEWINQLSREPFSIPSKKVCLILVTAPSSTSKDDSLGRAPCIRNTRR